MQQRTSGLQYAPSWAGIPAVSSHPFIFYRFSGSRIRSIGVWGGVQPGSPPHHRAQRTPRLKQNDNLNPSCGINDIMSGHDGKYMPLNNGKVSNAERTATDSRRFFWFFLLNERFCFQNISYFQGCNGTMECHWKHLELNYFNIHCIQKESESLVGVKGEKYRYSSLRWHQHYEAKSTFRGKTGIWMVLASTVHLGKGKLWEGKVINRPAGSHPLSGCLLKSTGSPPHILIFYKINWLPASLSGSFVSKWRVRLNRCSCQFVSNIPAHSSPPSAYFNLLHW